MKKEFKPSLIIGAFLSVFSVCVLIAIPYTPTYHGKITNLICGAVMLIISVGFIIGGFMKDKPESKCDVVD